jgi:hypothetical protein
MTTDYRPMKWIRFADLADGRLEAFGVWEHFVPGATSDNAKCLTDGDGHLWVHAGCNGFIESITIYGDSDNGSILAAIGKAFNTEIFSEFEPAYWGYDTLLRTSEQVGAMAPHDPASGHRKVASADLTREAEKFAVEFQGFISAEPVR